MGKGRSVSSSFASPSPAGCPTHGHRGASVARGCSAATHPRRALRRRQAWSHMERQADRHDDGLNDLAPDARTLNLQMEDNHTGEPVNFACLLDRPADAGPLRKTDVRFISYNPPWLHNRQSLPKGKDEGMKDDGMKREPVGLNHLWRFWQQCAPTSRPLLTIAN